jgi:hypothetical protein
MNNIEVVIAALMAAILASPANGHRFASQHCASASQLEDSHRSPARNLSVANAIPVAKCRAPSLPAEVKKNGLGG